jgi:YVTN family beta-propeller protein
VSVVDTATLTVTATIPVGSEPLGVAVSPDGSKVYVANKGSDIVSVIDRATLTVTATIALRFKSFPDALGSFIQ